MKNTFSFSRKHFLALLGGLVLLAILIAAVCFFSDLEMNMEYGQEQPSQQQGQEDAHTPSDVGRAEIYIDGKKYAAKDSVETILFVGVDKYEMPTDETYINGQQADLLMLLVMDHNTKSYDILQLNRDTVTQIQTLGITGDSAGTIDAQIALSHAYGTGGKDSSLNTVDAVSNLLYGIEIDHYMTIRMSAIPILNNAVDGVTLELLEDFVGLNPTYKKGTSVTLSGEEAVAYVQYRVQMENSTNTNRMARQKQYMAAWSEQFRQKLATEDSFVVTTVLEISDYLVSDMTVEEMDGFASSFASYTSNGISDIAGDSVKGEEFMEFHVDEKALQQQVVNLFYEPAE